MAGKGSNVKILVSLGINSEQSKKNIQQYIDKLKLQDLNVTLNVKNTSSNNKVFQQMQKEIETLKQEIKDLNKLLDNVGKGSSSNSGKASRIISDLKHEQEQIRRFLQKQFKTNTFDFKLNIDTSNGQKVLKGFTANIRDVNGEIKKLSFDGAFNQLNTSLKDNKLKSYKSSLDAVNKTLESVKNKALLSSKEIEKFQTKLNNIKTNDNIADKTGSFNKLKQDIESTIASTKRFDKVTKDINNAIISISRNGSISSERLRELITSISKINSQNITLDEKVVKLRRELTRLNSELSDVSHTNKMNNAMENAKRKVMDLESAFVRMVNQNKRSVKQIDLTPYKRQLEELSRIPIFRNQRDIDNFNNKLKNTQSNIRRLNSDITIANRSNQTFIQMLKTAMEKFPIWMVASTAFFGVTRTAREFGQIIVDIDTKMVSLQKVMSESTNFEKIFDNATASAEKFGQSISNVMDSYIEFAKQGFKEDDLTYLADAALIASNVADLDAQKSSEYLTATMIQWKKESSEAMEVVDAWNEISNNYATTTEKLADGQAKAAATARAMGLDFNQLNGIIGTVNCCRSKIG